MANINDFRDFDAFRACRGFSREVGFLVRSSPLRQNRRLVDQMERAAISVLSNFAEGAERDGNPEFIHFVTICKGSIGELRAQLIYCLDIELIDQVKYKILDEMAGSASKLVGGLARYLKTSGNSKIAPVHYGRENSLKAKAPRQGRVELDKPATSN
jgi:four helix bundle protein